MATVVTIEDLCSQLGTLPTNTIVAVEGFCGSGKTTLANQLSDALSLDVIHLDSFARKFDAPPSYPECLDLAAAKTKLAQRDGRPLIIEGICLRDVLLDLGVSTNIYIYLKRLGDNELWYDGLHLASFIEGNPVPGDMNEPHRSDFEYHARERPHERATYVVERIEIE